MYVDVFGCVKTSSASIADDDGGDGDDGDGDGGDYRGGGDGGDAGDGGGALYLRVVTYSDQPVAVRTGNQWLTNSHDDAMIECMQQIRAPGWDCLTA